MTILLATKRDSFAILAAERCESRPDAPPQCGDSKLVRHPNPGIPLAFGITTNNSWWVPAPGQPGRSFRNFLVDLMGEIDSPNALDLSVMANRVKSIFMPGYAEMQRDAVVAIAMFCEGKTRIGLQHIGERTDLIEDRTQLFHPCTLSTFYNDKRCEALRDRRTSDPKALVEIARQLVLDGILYEEANVPHEKRQCGGKVDVMLVDKDGANPV